MANRMDSEDRERPERRQRRSVEEIKEKLEAAKEKFANGDFDKSDVVEMIKERRGGKGDRRLAKGRFIANRMDSEDRERPERRQRRSVEEIKEKLQAAKEKFANGDFDKNDMAEMIKEKMGDKFGDLRERLEAAK